MKPSRFRTTILTACAAAAAAAWPLTALPAAAGTGPTSSAAPASMASTQAEAPCRALTEGSVDYPSEGANRVTFATAGSYAESSVLITGCVAEDGGYVEEWQTSGYSGVNGFAPPGRMTENSLQSPTGSFTMTEALGRSNPGTALHYYDLNPRSRWGGEPGPNYNQYFEGKDRGADENLWWYMQRGYYEQAAVINWNRPPDMPTMQGASFAIFLHAGNAETVGCISTDLATVTRLLQNAVPGDRVIMGVEDEIFSPPAPGRSATEPTVSTASLVPGSWTAAASLTGLLTLLAAAALTAFPHRYLFRHGREPAQSAPGETNAHRSP